MKKKIGLKIFLLSLLSILILVLGVLFFYLPRYLTKDVLVSTGESNGEDFTVMSTNVRFYTPLDFLQKSWFYRAELIAADIAAVCPDILCLQEVTPLHYDYLKDIMPDYNSLITYRDEFVLSEGCPIFWRADRFEKISSGSFWLSETPEVMSKDWGSEHYRICVYVCLKDRNTGKEFIVFNTHLDNKSEEARIKGIEVVLDKIAELDGRPAFLLGDLNAKENTPTILSTKEHFDDAQKIATITESSPTYHNWGKQASAKRIDYILISKGDATVSEYHVVNNCHNGVYSSDHASIYIKTKIN